ncbi:DUF4188 domain-containing protein [Microbacterium sp. PMB16]|uniref:DUF4188 domain-containing protein n=1 Tax=Microbacterium sp. PMB16 TaxID=3120157 RepID=UPI003F4B228B
MRRTVRGNRPYRSPSRANRIGLPTFFSMPRMLRELATDHDSGFLGYELLLGAGGPYVVQYWSSVDKLYAYASSPSQEHRPAWTRFNKMARKAPGAVGIWHETFLVDRAESVYVSTKPMGLPKATEMVEVGKRQDRAQARFAEGRTVSGQAQSPEILSEPRLP